ncbi:hypothetical protein PMM47T1_14075 [Pseudomonas sp. M47T1]|uniref:hypothetical protein n=1 Tax=Pseudomonas sp. M47T1 TaxID=1179778 RepID=UPI000260883B|nr:hypothetical protein [Pseudomonas sp. M47T1]EIK96093.1 hypothetical protein PMM47T1_14075 [Pseudomonas sp. M47T1]
MALTQKQRDERRQEKAGRLQEVIVRLPLRPGTKQALLELMDWAEVEEQAEAMTLMIHRLHELGRGGATRFLTPPLHKITISPAVERKLELAYQREAMRISREPQDSIEDDQ